MSTASSSGIDLNTSKDTSMESDLPPLPESPVNPPESPPPPKPIETIRDIYETALDLQEEFGEQVFSDKVAEEYIEDHIIEFLNRQQKEFDKAQKQLGRDITPAEMELYGTQLSRGIIPPAMLNPSINQFAFGAPDPKTNIQVTPPKDLFGSSSGIHSESFTGFVTPATKSPLKTPVINSVLKSMIKRKEISPLDNPISPISPDLTTPSKVYKPTPSTPSKVLSYDDVE